MKTNKRFLPNVAALSLGALLAAAPLTASAVFIEGRISFSGSVGLDAPILTTTAFTSFSGVEVTLGTQMGDYLGTGGTTGVSMSGFQFDPTLNPDPVAPLWEFTVGPTTYSFDLENLVSVTRSNLGAGLYSLQVAGTGTASITGFDDTPGAFSVTTTGDDDDTSLGFGSFTFVEGREVVPDGGASVFLLGFSLLGVCVFRHWITATR